MTGAELKAVREKLGINQEELAGNAGVAPAAIAQWESDGVPHAESGRIDWVLWELGKRKALAECGLPECDWMKWWNAQPQTQSPVQANEAVEKHTAGCPCCQARVQYVKEHVRPAPPISTPRHPLLAGLPLWLVAVIGGGMVVLIAGGGANAANLLFDGRPFEAVLAVLLCFSVGAFAGLAYHFTRPLRDKELGLHISWILVAEAYALSAVALAFGLGSLTDSQSSDDQFGIFMVVFLAAVAVLGGLGFGYMDQLERRKTRKPPYRLLSWILPAVMGVAAILLIIGAGAFLFAWQQQPLTQATVEARDITLQELLDKGFGANRHVRIKGFRFCDNEVPFEKSTYGSLRYFWVPAVPDNRGEHPRAIPAVPAQLQAVLSDSKFVKDDPALFTARIEQEIRRQTETQGYKGMVVNGIRGLSRKAQQELRKLAPQTDFAKLLMIDYSTQPVSEESIQGWLLVGGVAAGIGVAMLLLVVFLRVKKQTA